MYRTVTGWAVRRAVQSLFVCGVLLPACVQGQSLRPSPGLRVTLDGEPVKLDPIVVTDQTCLVGFDSAVRVMSHGQCWTQGRNTIVGPYGALARYERSRDGKSAWVEIAGRRHPVPDVPFPEKLSDGRTVVLVDLEGLAGVLGVTVDWDGKEMALFSPEYWCKRLGIPERVRRHRIAHNSDLLPEMGISPPAQRVLVWVRPSVPCWVQVYKLSGGEPRPMMGYEYATDKPIHYVGPDLGYAASWQGKPGVPLRIQTDFFRKEFYTDKRAYGEYVGVVTKAKIPADDLLKKISDGSIKESEWCVVGIRQRITSNPLLFGIHEVLPGETLGKIAERYRMTKSFLAELNGLRVGEECKAGDELAVLKSSDKAAAPPASVPVQRGLYEVQPGESVASISKRCGTTEARFRAANPGIPPGAEVEPGDLVYLPIPERRVAAPLKPNVIPVTALAQVKARTPVYDRRGPGARIVAVLEPGEVVQVFGHYSNGDRKIVTHRPRRGAEVVAMIQSNQLAWERSAGGTCLKPTSEAAKVVAEAVRWVGLVKYKWGGNQLKKGGGIDCSHFVAQVFASVKQRAPDPPVSHQENFGRLVHRRGGPAEEFARTVVMDPSQSFSSLMPGDRVIFQRDPYAVHKSGNYHTGIYIGAYKDKQTGKEYQHAVVHANSRRNGVSIDALDDPSYLGKIYRYTVRGADSRQPLSSTRLPLNLRVAYGRLLP